jgi:mevalonate kinase
LNVPLTQKRAEMTLPSIPPPLFETRACGKLLLTGEYFVLDGATALALPVRYGQSLRIEKGQAPSRLLWTSKTDEGISWFLAEYELPSLVALSFTEKKVAETLSDILRKCQAQNPAFLTKHQSFKALTLNDFPREWGLGTSSTLIATIAKWANVDPYPVLFDTMGGSGYDIACAYSDGPILYRLNGSTPEVRPAHFQPAFSDSLWFVFLGKKQDSREGIRRYRERAQGNAELVAEVSRLTQQFVAAEDIQTLETVMREHEALISETLALPRAHDLYFNDFWGETKSLGAWGGDFVLATSERPAAETQAYFKKKGFEVVLSWAKMAGPLKGPSHPHSPSPSRID